MKNKIIILGLCAIIAACAKKPLTETQTSVLSGEEIKVTLLELPTGCGGKGEVMMGSHNNPYTTCTEENGRKLVCTYDSSRGSLIGCYTTNQ